jgi:hypothetical protein
MANEDVRLFKSLCCCRVKIKKKCEVCVCVCVCVCVINFLVADKQSFHLQLIHAVKMPRRGQKAEQRRSLCLV